MCEFLGFVFVVALPVLIVKAMFWCGLFVLIDSLNKGNWYNAFWGGSSFFLACFAVALGAYSTSREGEARLKNYWQENWVDLNTRYGKLKWLGTGAQLAGGSLMIVSEEYSQLGGKIALGGLVLEKVSEWKKENLQNQLQAVIEQRPHSHIE